MWLKLKEVVAVRRNPISNASIIWYRLFKWIWFPLCDYFRTQKNHQPSLTLVKMRLVGLLLLTITCCKSATFRHKRQLGRIVLLPLHFRGGASFPPTPHPTPPPFPPSSSLFLPSNPRNNEHTHTHILSRFPLFLSLAPSSARHSPSLFLSSSFLRTQGLARSQVVWVEEKE